VEVVHGAGVWRGEGASYDARRVGVVREMLEVQLARPGRDRIARAHASSVTACAV
jgi:hypothetical protein